MKKLYLMVGIAGSGKSTWCKNNKNNEDIYISRDEVRFSILDKIGPNAQYFQAEKQVFNEFINKINEALESQNGDVYVDATHVSKVSRAKVLSKIKVPCEVIAVTVLIDLESAIEVNKKRTGRAAVPESVVRKMYNDLTIPEENEGIDKLIIIDRIKYK